VLTVLDIMENVEQLPVKTELATPLTHDPKLRVCTLPAWLLAHVTGGTSKPENVMSVWLEQSTLIDVEKELGIQVPFAYETCRNRVPEQFEREYSRYTIASGSGAERATFVAIIELKPVYGNPSTLQACALKGATVNSSSIGKPLQVVPEYVVSRFNAKPELRSKKKSDITMKVKKKKWRKQT
jgi:hypothetical protein